jgi:acyl-homoserine-lactone acylase
MKIFLLSLVSITWLSAFTQWDSSRVTIARDSLGVPHIFGKTDADVSYGLAWAHAEDNFKDIQYVLLTGKGLLGKAIGKDGAKADYAAALLRCRDIAEEKQNTLAPAFRKVLDGYIRGINDYAKLHPEEVLVKKAFPATITDYLSAVSFSLCIISGADKVIGNVMGNKATVIPGFQIGGSNAFAIHPSKTTTGEAFLAINSHQPLEGPVAWYEAHLSSDEGLNIIGALFPGGATVFAGVNEHLGWAHTVNMMDKIDVFQLKMNKKNDQYEFDGNWLPLEKRKVKLRVKGIPFPIGKSVYWSKYGATVKTDQGVFSIRLTANQDVKAVEQWWLMNKARNFSEFYEAISMQGLPMMNIVYADRYDTIFYVSGGKMPVRNNSSIYTWSSTVPGNTSSTLWEKFHTLADLPQLLNPAPGYVYNTNHSPFLATAPGSNPDPSKYDITSGYETYHNNRSYRLQQMIGQFDKVDYPSFKMMKYDKKLPTPLQYPVNTDTLFLLDPAEDTATGAILKSLQTWDRMADTSSEGAAAFLQLYHMINERRQGSGGDVLYKKDIYEMLTQISSYQRKYFGKVGVTLGELQRHSRGNKDYPSWGLPDVLMAMHSKPQADGRYKVIAGESFIQLVRFPKNALPIIESINCYGASSKPGSRHYNDQMELYLQQKPRLVSLDKQTVLKNAEQVYNPPTVK